jgi:peptidyl-prolyl cis-trans isomerase SurA
VGDVSHVFESEFGWHFLRVEEKRTADMSDEFQKLKARQTLHKRRFNEELELWLQEMRQETYVDIRI